MDVAISMKGQLFILASIIMVVMIVLIKNNMVTYEISQESRFNQPHLIKEKIRNIIRESRQIAGVSAISENPVQSGIQYLSDFAFLLRNDIDADILFFYVVFNSSENRYYFSAVNFMKEPLNITINASYSSPSSYNFIVDDKSSFLAVFNTTQNGEIELNVSYRGRKGTETERFNITSSEYNFMRLFSSVKISSNQIEVGRKDLYRWLW